MLAACDVKGFDGGGVRADDGVRWTREMRPAIRRERRGGWRNARPEKWGIARNSLSKQGFYAMRGAYVPISASHGAAQAIGRILTIRPDARIIAR
jgi:hypothetical protein